MRERDAAHVERRRVGRYLVGIVDEDELGVRIDGAPDQPGAGGPSTWTPRRVAHLMTRRPSPRASPRRRPGPARALRSGSSRDPRSGAARDGDVPACGDALGRLLRSRASAVTRAYSAPTASAIRRASSRSWAAVPGSAIQTLASPPCSTTSSASHSSRSRDAGIGRQRHQAVGQLGHTQAAQTAPQRDPRGRGLARQSVREEDPAVHRPSLAI